MAFSIFLFWIQLYYVTGNWVIVLNTINLFLQSLYFIFELA